MKKNPKSLIKVLFGVTFLIAFISTVTISMFWVYYQYSEFIKESKKLKQNYIKSQKELIKNEVNKVIEYVEFKKSKVEEKLKEALKSRVYQAYTIAKSIYEENKNIKSAKEIKYMIVSALKNISFSNKRSYYFINRNDGVAILFNTKSKLNQNVNILNLQDKRGQFIIQNQIKIAKEKGEGFLVNYFVKPDEDTKIEYPKLSFVKLFEPYDWHIGMGEYLDDFTNEFQNEILERIASIRFGKEGYIFVNRLDGYALISHGKKWDKPIKWDMATHLDIDQFKEQKDASKNFEGGYFYYQFPKLSSNESSPKISFVKRIKEWDWIVGGGVYVDEIEKVLKEKERNLKEDIKRNIIIIIIFLLFLTIAIFLFSRAIADYINLNIKTLNKFFEEASNKSVEIDESKLNFLEFKVLAKSLNNMLYKRNLAEEKLKEINLTLEKKVQDETEKNLQKERILTMQSKMALMGEMINAIAHQWRQPLNALGLVIQKLKLLFKKEKLNAETIDEIVFKSMKQIDFMSNTIDDFRNFFKSDKEAKEFCLKEAIVESIAIIEAQLKHHSIKVEIEAIEELIYFGYENEFKQVILNILNNAKDAILQKERQDGIITINLSQDEKYFFISISDNGGGISEEIIERIFEPYFSTKDTEGTGIGLYMSKMIIENNMRGKIEALNIDGGAKFNIKLPKGN